MLALRRPRLHPIVLLGLLGLAACWGGPVEQSPACAAYVRCIQAIDVAAGQTTDLDRYVVDGTCWGNPTLGEGCTRSCERALERLRTDPSLPAGCAP